MRPPRFFHSVILQPQVAHGHSGLLRGATLPVRRPGVIHGVTPSGSVSYNVFTIVTRSCDGRHTNLRRSSQDIMKIFLSFVSNSTVEIIGKWVWTGFCSLGSSGVEVPMQSLRASSQPAPAFHHHPLVGVQACPRRKSLRVKLPFGHKIEHTPNSSITCL